MNNKYKNVVKHRKRIGLQLYRERYRYAIENGVSSETANELKFKSQEHVETAIQQRLIKVKQQLLALGLNEAKADELKVLSKITLEKRGYLVDE